MKWICVREFGLHKPGSVVEMPDGAALDPEHWEHYEPVTPPAGRQSGEGLAPAPAGAVGGQSSVPLAFTVTPKEGA